MSTATGETEAEWSAGSSDAFPQSHGLSKTATGISGLDEVTGGGLPRGRPTLVCGPAGSGKTLMGMEFLVRGITEFDEPGVFLSFEETVSDLKSNFTSLGFDLAQLEADGRLMLDHVMLIHGEMEETGDWDLEGLFLRLGAAIDAVGAKRVVIDTIEALFGAFTNSVLLRSEFVRLCSFLKERGVTAVITGEQGDRALTRHGIEEYVFDCVIVLDHRVIDQTSIRRLRIVKYRGSFHGTNEYPFLISESGISMLPVTSLALQHTVSAAWMTTGIPGLDSMLGRGGFFRGSTIHVSGTSGTGKTTIAAQFCDVTCARGERVVFCSFDESQDEILRNMSSVGLDLRQWVEAGLLKFQCFRPSFPGLEWHLYKVQEFVSEFDPSVVVMDPISDFGGLGTALQVSALLIRQVDFLKARGVTSMFTSLTDSRVLTSTEQQMTSLVDMWIPIEMVRANGEHNRVLYILKARGMASSNQLRELLLSDDGVELADVYVGPEGVLTRSAGVAQVAKEQADGESWLEDLEQEEAAL